MKGCPPGPSLPQTSSLGLALERGIWTVVKFFVSLLIFFFFFSLVKFFFCLLVSESCLQMSAWEISVGMARKCGFNWFAL